MAGGADVAAEGAEASAPAPHAAQEGARKKKKKGNRVALQHRFYEAEFPKPGEIVVVQVRGLGDLGIYATLLEYGGKEGMMLLSEVSKHPMKSPTKLVRVGRIQTCMILEADEKAGCIDLSKRKVGAERAAIKEVAFSRAKAVHGIMWHVASSNGVEVEELCKKVSWPLFKRYEDAFQVLKRHTMGEINVWEELDFSQPGKDLSDIAAKVKGDIESAVRSRYRQHVAQLKAKIEISCSGYSGIDAVKEAILAGLEAPRADGCQLEIRLIAHPIFVIECSCLETEPGVAAIDAAAERVEKSIKASGGYFRLRSHPVLVGLESEDEDEEEEGDDEDDGLDRAGAGQDGAEDGAPEPDGMRVLFHRPP